METSDPPDSPDSFDPLPQKGSFAVIFVSRATGEDPEGYADVAEYMVSLARQMPGFLGLSSARGTDGVGITVSYWRSEGEIAAWKRQLDHAEARRLGKLRWYDCYQLVVARVERSYAFARSP